MWSPFPIGIGRHDTIQNMREMPIPIWSFSKTFVVITWSKAFETAGQESSFLSDVIQGKGSSTLAVVGSTRGSSNGADMDGIIAKSILKTEPSGRKKESDAR